MPDLPTGVSGVSAASAPGLVPLKATSDGRFVSGRDGVAAIATTGDRKVEFVDFGRHELALVRSALGYPAYYPVHPVAIEKPVKAVLMDLDGTSVRSEPFWIWMIQLTTASLARRPGVRARGRRPALTCPATASPSICEYCIRKYCPGRTVEEARALYFEHTHREMAEILAGRGRRDAFVPAPGLEDFLRALKARGIKVGLVTSGLHEKAYPEIVAAFRRADAGRPARVLRRHHHGRLPAAARRGWHARRAVAQAAPVALRGGLPRRPRHPLRGAPLGRRHRGQRRGDLRDPAGRVRGDRHRRREHRVERHARPLCRLLPIARRRAAADQLTPREVRRQRTRCQPSVDEAGR